MSDLTEKRTFEGGMNSDDSPERMGQGDYFNALNFRYGTYESGNVDGLMPIPGVGLLFNRKPAYDPILLPKFWNIGGCEDQERKRIIYFVASDIGPGYIACWDIRAKAGFIVLSDNDVIGGLGFDRFSYIHSCFVINGVLYWTDNLNEPRRINIDAAISLQDPTVLPRNSIVINNVLSTGGGFLHNLYTFDIDFFYIVPGILSTMGPGIYMQLIRTGTAGSSSQPANIFVPIDWTNYLTTPYYTILANALTAYFTTLDPTGTNWNIVVTPITANISQIQLNIEQTWDWGTGNPLFAPTVNVELQLFNLKVPAYTAPLSQPVISWIRRQPGMAPIFTKVYQTAPPFNSNQIQLEAFQICYRYVYRGNEVSTLSCLSRTANYNANGERSNRIDIVIPLTEKIEQDVRKVDLVAVYLNSGTYFIIKSWDKNNPTDGAAIAQHNNGTIPLQYIFYNNQTGIALDSAYSVKPYDSVPLLAETAALAKNRCFLGNTTAGYDSPQITSLTAIASTKPAVSSNLGEWFFFRYRVTINVGGVISSFENSVYLIYIIDPGIPLGAGYFTTRIGIDPQGPPFPVTVDYTLLTYRGGSLYDVMTTAFDGTPLIISVPTEFTQLQYTDLNVSSEVLNLPSGSNLPSDRVFKSGCGYKLGLTFYDNYGRKCGVVTNPGLQINIDETKYNLTENTPLINWTLSNDHAVGEIPDWAYYFSVDITKCLTTRFFIQARTKAAAYADLGTDGLYNFDTLAFGSGLAGCAFDITSLNSFQMGYVFNEGDILKLHLNVLVEPILYYLKIITQSGKWLVTELVNLGTLDSASSFLFEIFTPYHTSTDEPYFEQGFICPISNPGTAARSYGIMNGSLYGDVSLIVRNDGTNNYITENMSPNDKFWKIWNTDAGRPNFLDFIGQVFDKNAVSFSNTLVQGSRINGLSTFDALDKVDLPVELGGIQKLQLTSKIQKEGTVMLAVCDSEIVSLYLGETQVASPQGDAFLSVSNNVIGTIYPLKGSFGTADPSSVKPWRGNVFGYDRYNGIVWQYSDNGLEAISNFKMRTFWRLWSEIYSGLSQDEIAALDTQPFVVGGIDPFNGEYMLSLPRILQDNPNTPLPGYVTPPANQFNPMDGQAKTMVFKIGKNRWMPCPEFYSEFLVNAGNELYGCTAVGIYLHNDVTAPYAFFYGEQKVCKVMVPANILPDGIKIFKAMNVQASLLPGTAIILASYPYNQLTDIVSTEWGNKEGVFYAVIKRNRNDPKFFPDFDQALSRGEKIRATSAKIQVSFTPSQPFNLRAMNINTAISTGHKTVESQ